MTRSVGPPAGPGTARIAVDLLGGDHAPAVVVDGALRASGADPDLHLLLVGPSPVADEVIAALPGPARDRVATLPVERGVGMGDPVTHGADRRTSIGAAALALAAGAADALVSAGSSGATVAAAVMAVGRTPGVRRPALAAILASATHPLVFLDVGAGMQCTAADLVQHAALGAGYARHAAGLARPRVGLLSVGTEPGKGDRLRRATDAALRLHPLGDAVYVGTVEGSDVVTGARADVVVTDGFTGNVLLKGVESALAAAAAPHPPTAVPRAAALLGVAGTVVVCHGAADAEDLASGISLAAGLVRAGITGRLAEITGLSAWTAQVAQRLAEGRTR
ncbi:MAG: phosphate acyltransferase PlsX [Micromonosporaceae bacterium]